MTTFGVRTASEDHNAAGVSQTRQAQGVDTSPIGCLGHHLLSLDAIYEDVLSASVGEVDRMRRGQRSD
jgi:hypothetical protein